MVRKGKETLEEEGRRQHPLLTAAFLSLNVPYALIKLLDHKQDRGGILPFLVEFAFIP